MLIFNPQSKISLKLYNTIIIHLICRTSKINTTFNINTYIC